MNFSESKLGGVRVVVNMILRYAKMLNCKVMNMSSLLEIFILHEIFLPNLLKKFARKDFFVIFSNWQVIPL